MRSRLTVYIGEPANPPVPWVERIDPRALDLIWHVVPDGRERENFLAVDDHAPGHAERSVDREDFSRGARHDLGLEPAVLGALARVELPDQVIGDSTQIAHDDLIELAVTDRAAHRRSHTDPLTRPDRRVERLLSYDFKSTLTGRLAHFHHTRGAVDHRRTVILITCAAV